MHWLVTLWLLLTSLELLLLPVSIMNAILFLLWATMVEGYEHHSSRQFGGQFPCSNYICVCHQSHMKQKTESADGVWNTKHSLGGETIAICVRKESSGTREQTAHDSTTGREHWASFWRGQSTESTVPPHPQTRFPQKCHTRYREKSNICNNVTVILNNQPKTNFLWTFFLNSIGFIIHHKINCI